VPAIVRSPGGEAVTRPSSAIATNVPGYAQRIVAYTGSVGVDGADPEELAFVRD
jgi:hypothetical protein